MVIFIPYVRIDLNFSLHFRRRLICTSFVAVMRCCRCACSTLCVASWIRTDVRNPIDDLIDARTGAPQGTAAIEGVFAVSILDPGAQDN
jgi:hypothetical protein